MWRGVPSLTEASPHCREATPLQQGDMHLYTYLKRKKFKAKATKWKADANKRKSTSNTWYFTYSSHQSSIKHANKHKSIKKTTTYQLEWIEMLWKLKFKGFLFVVDTC